MTFCLAYTDVHPIYDDMLCGPNTERDRKKLNSVLSERPTAKKIDKVFSLSFDTRTMKFGKQIVEKNIPSEPTISGEPSRQQRPVIRPSMTRAAQSSCQPCSVYLGDSRGKD